VLADVTPCVAPGRVVGLLGPAGTTGTAVRTLTRIGSFTGTAVGVVTRGAPLYADLSVADHLRLGARLNPRWDGRLAQRRVEQAGLDPAQKAGRLSGGQQAQLALTLAVARRPELLVFDDPITALDPLARRDFLNRLAELVAELEISAILSTPVLDDVERVCDHLVLLCAGRVQLAGRIDDLIAEHFRLTGARCELRDLPPGIEVIRDEQVAAGRRQLVVRRSAVPIPRSVRDVRNVSLEEMVLAYLARQSVESTNGGDCDRTFDRFVLRRGIS
jgi:ABC-2 type transport system ATP-binding protein